MKTVEIKWRYVEVALITILSSIIVLDLVYVMFRYMHWAKWAGL